MCWTSSSIHNMYIKACKMCLFFLVCLPAHPCVFVSLVCLCVCCMVCVSQSCSVFCSVQCLCVIDLVSNPFHLADSLPPLWPHHHCCQNFLYFQNQLFLLRQPGADGGLREPCVAFYEPSQLHALVAAAGNKEERLDKMD